MKKIFLAALLCAATLTVKSADANYNSSADANYNVVPLPQSIVMQKGAFTLSASTPIVAQAELSREAEFLSQYVDELTGIRLSVASGKVKSPAIRLALDKKNTTREGYKIVVTAKGITITAGTAAGVFYGIQTLRKALPVEADAQTAITLPAATITDAPRFGYRGMMLDCGRHYFSIDFIKKFIDLEALHNMNVLHWHLSEDQGWRIEIKKYPKLTEIGAWRDQTVLGHNTGLYDNTRYGGFYTQDEAREIVAYARERHITVIPEIDMPGHTTSVLAAYPELGCTGQPQKVAQTWGVFSTVLCLSNEKVYEFCDDVVKELSQIFPSVYFHIGGDEAPTEQWEQCPNCRKLAADNGVDIKHVQQLFTARLAKIVEGYGKKVIGWNEILEGGRLDKSVTVQVWTGGEESANQGYDIIQSPTKHCYFDYAQAEGWSEPLTIGGFLPVEKVYEFDPAPPTMTATGRQHVLGAQGNLWTEYIGYSDMAEYQLLPRMAALAEVQWMQVDKKNYKEFKVRAAQLAKDYDKYGLKYAKHMWAKEK